MPAATLSHSRSARIPLAAYDVNPTIEDDWGPFSVPPSNQAAVPWDDQVVPALRRKLEQQSRDLTKRISRIEESDAGWARPRESIERRDVRASREIVHTHRESSIDQYHNRFASVRSPKSRDIVASSFPFDSPAQRSSGSSDATQRAREKARQIAARQHAARLSQASTDSPQQLGSSMDRIPETDRTSFERRRIRTQSTPMRPSIDAPPPPTPSSPPPPPGHQRTASLSRRKAAALDPKLMEEFGPLGSSSPNARRAHLDDASPMRRTQPDAFKSLSDASLTPERVRGMREASAPPAFGRTDEFGALGSPASLGASPSRSVNWEDQIIPTVARKLQQQQLLASNSKTHEALIDTWDRNGLPLSQTDFAAQQRASRLEADKRDAELRSNHTEPTQQEQEPIESEVREAPTVDRARSRSSQHSAQQQQQQQQQQEQMALQELAPPHVQQTYAAPPMQQVTARTAPPAKRTDTHGKSGCCCIVM